MPWSGCRGLKRIFSEGGTCRRRRFLPISAFGCVGAPPRLTGVVKKGWQCGWLRGRDASGGRILTEKKTWGVLEE